MSLHVYAQAYYACYGDEFGEWRQDDWHAMKFNKAIKGEQVNGFAWVPTPDGSLKVNETLKENAFIAFGRWGRKQLELLGVQTGVLVPIPSSSKVDFASDCPPWKLARALAAGTQGRFTVLPCLAWAEAREPGHVTGRRKTTYEVEQLLITNAADLQGKRLILVDDMLTKGAHMRGTANFLRARGATVEIGLCAGRATHEQAANPFAVEVCDVEAAPPVFDFDALDDGDIF